MLLTLLQIKVPPHKYNSIIYVFIFLFQNHLISDMEPFTIRRGVREKIDDGVALPSSLYQRYQGHLALKIVQKGKDLKVKIFHALDIGHHEKVKIVIRVHGNGVPEQRTYRTKLIREHESKIWNEKWTFRKLPTNLNEVTVSLVHRPVLYSQDAVISCMSFDLKPPSMFRNTVVADGSYCLLSPSIGYCKNSEVTGPLGICAPPDNVHSSEGSITTEHHRVILRPFPSTHHIGIQFCCDDSEAVISHIHPNSHAERLGLMVGDVIISVNKHDVTCEGGKTVEKLIKARDYSKPLDLTVARYTGDDIICIVTP